MFRRALGSQAAMLSLGKQYQLTFRATCLHDRTRKQIR